MARITIPIETKLRELDGKLWLAIHLLANGHDIFIGSLDSVEAALTEIRPTLHFMVKQGRSVSFLQSLRKAGIKTLSLSAEGGIFPDDNIFRDILNPELLKRLDGYCAWGERPAEIVRKKVPEMSKRVYVTGTPKFDLLQESKREFYRPEAERLQDKYGDYIMVNTNFVSVNHYNPKLAKIQNKRLRKTLPKTDKRTLEGKHRPYMKLLMEAFIEVVHSLKNKFPDLTIIVRPHPSENHETYRKHFQASKRIVVNATGPVAPWLLGARAVIHNNCTTGVESVLLERPTLAYIPKKNSDYGHIVPNAVSQKCYNEQSLTESINDILSKNKSTYSLNNKQKELIEKYLHYMDGKAVERILKVIQDLSPAKKLNGPVSLPQRLDYRRWILKFVGRKGLNFTRKIRKILSGNTDPGYFLQKFPGLSISEIELKLERFRKIKPSVSVEDIHIERVKYFPKIYHLTTD